MRDGPGTDEGDVGDVRVGGQVVGGGGPEREGLQEVGRVAAGFAGRVGRWRRRRELTRPFARRL